LAVAPEEDSGKFPTRGWALSPRVGYGEKEPYSAQVGFPFFFSLKMLSGCRAALGLEAARYSAAIASRADPSEVVAFFFSPLVQRRYLDPHADEITALSSAWNPLLRVGDGPSYS